MSLAGAKFPAKLKELLGQKMKDSGGVAAEEETVDAPIGGKNE